MPNFRYDGPVSVIRLELDASDVPMRRRLERHWEAVFRLRRALQRDAAARCRAYWAAHHERAADPKAVRERLGLTARESRRQPKAHIEASGWMGHHLTKAVGLHVADAVWEPLIRHLFPDASRRRHGRPPWRRWCSPGCPVGIWCCRSRLPQGAGQWPHLAHFLADPTVWHKIDLVRVRDRRAPGGWRY